MGKVVWACACGYLISDPVPVGGDAVAALLALAAEGRANHSCTFTVEADKGGAR